MNDFQDKLHKARESAPEGGCAPQGVLVSQDDCPACDDISGSITAMIDAGEVRVVKADSDEGLGLLAQARVDMVPQLFLVDCDGQVAAQADLTAAESTPPQSSPAEDLTVMKRTIVDNVIQMATGRNYDPD